MDGGQWDQNPLGVGLSVQLSPENLGFGGAAPGVGQVGKPHTPSQRGFSSPPVLGKGEEGGGGTVGAPRHAVGRCGVRGEVGTHGGERLRPGKLGLWVRPWAQPRPRTETQHRWDHPLPPPPTPPFCPGETEAQWSISSPSLSPTTGHSPGRGRIAVSPLLPSPHALPQAWGGSGGCSPDPPPTFAFQCHRESADADGVDPG